MPTKADRSPQPANNRTAGGRRLASTPRHTMQAARNGPPSVAGSLQAFLEAVAQARSPNTLRAYRNGLDAFQRTLVRIGLDPGTLPAGQASEEWIVPFSVDLKRLTPATEQLYLTAAVRWYEFLAAERMAEINLARLRLLIRHRARRPGKRLPQFPRETIERILAYAADLGRTLTRDERERLRALRDRAFLFTLADTGLRVHEACGLRRGDIDWSEGRAILIGKGNRQAVVRFSQRSLAALRDYLRERSKYDGASGRPLAALPMFARHDRGAARKVQPITTTTGRNIVHQRAAEALGAGESAGVTPHSFRHYFVTVVLRASGGNLKLAQELARHRSISVTQGYAHLSDDELDRAYYDIFDGEGTSS